MNITKILKQTKRFPKSEDTTDNLETVQVKDLHQAAMAISKAEIDMKRMLEIRNQALSAYKELGQTQI